MEGYFVRDTHTGSRQATCVPPISSIHAFRISRLSSKSRLDILRAIRRKGKKRFHIRSKIIYCMYNQLFCVKEKTCMIIFWSRLSSNVLIFL